jgi:hypothetical protein
MGQSWQEYQETQSQFSPEIYQLGEIHQLGLPEAMYRINVRRGVTFLLIWNVLVLLMSSLFVIPSISFPTEHFPMPIPTLVSTYGYFLLIPLIMLSAGIAGLVITLRQRHTRCYLYKQGLLLRKRRNALVQTLSWEQISYVRRSTSGKGRNFHYHITCRDGQRLDLSDQYIDYQDLFARIDREVVRKLLPLLRERYQEGELLSFGLYLSLNKFGLHINSRSWFAGSYPWSEIDSFQITDYTLQFFVRGKAKPIFAWVDNACVLRFLLKDPVNLQERPS